jgi:hypothetical protein
VRSVGGRLLPHTLPAAAVALGLVIVVSIWTLFFMFLMLRLRSPPADRTIHGPEPRAPDRNGRPVPSWDGPRSFLYNFCDFVQLPRFLRRGKEPKTYDVIND